jgi:hypothetical protein
LAKNLFELREYKKCHHLLKDYRGKYPDDQKLIFYYYYSLWMNGLIRKEEELYENGNILELCEDGTGKAPSHPDIQLL